MIHHVSFAARNPEHVANVLAEVLGGSVRPFLGPCPGAYNVMLEDEHGTAIEIYPEGTVALPGNGENQAYFERHEGAPAYGAFHFLISAKTDVATIQRIGEREGWKTYHCWRGPVGKGIELIELWVENRFQIELMTPEMTPGYVRFETTQVQDGMRQAMAAHWADRHAAGKPA